MSTQTEINKSLVQYLQKVGYRDDKIINAAPTVNHKLIVSPKKINPIQDAQTIWT